MNFFTKLEEKIIHAKAQWMGCSIHLLAYKKESCDYILLCFIWDGKLIMYVFTKLQEANTMKLLSESKMEDMSSLWRWRWIPMWLERWICQTIVCQRLKLKYGYTKFLSTKASNQKWNCQVIVRKIHKDGGWAVIMKVKVDASRFRSLKLQKKRVCCPNNLLDFNIWFKNSLQLGQKGWIFEFHICLSSPGLLSNGTDGSWFGQSYLEIRIFRRECAELWDQWARCVGQLQKLIPDYPEGIWLLIFDILDFFESSWVEWRGFQFGASSIKIWIFWWRRAICINKHDRI